MWDLKVEQTAQNGELSYLHEIMVRSIKSEYD